MMTLQRKDTPMHQDRRDSPADRVFVGLAAVLVVLAMGVAIAQIRADGFNVAAYSMLLVTFGGVMGVQRFYRAVRSGWKTRAAAWFERALVLGALASVLWLVMM